MNATHKARPVPGPDPAPARGVRVNVDHVALRRLGLLAPRRQERRLANEYRVIKRPLIGNAAGRGTRPIPRGNLIMVSSALSGEGKTFTCVNLCLSIALEKDWSVVLVDGDVVEPNLSRAFGVDREPGLTELLADPRMALRSCLLPTSIQGLSIVPAGQRNEFSAELLASARMEAIADELAGSRANRIVIFDSPPLLMTTEAPVLASHMGQVLVVVQAGRTAQQRVEQALSKLDPDKHISFVLNQAQLGDEALAYGVYGYGRNRERAEPYRDY